MKSSKIRASILTILVFSILPAYAGDKVGGVGAAVVCKSSAGQITSVKLLDLYQATLERGFKIPRSSNPIQTQIDKVLALLNPSLAYDVQERIAKIKIDYLPSNITQHQPYDLGSEPVEMEDGCSPEWVAFYGSDDHLKIVTKYFNRMSVTDRAALFIHEGIYKIARDYDHEIDSARSRKIVGVIFSSTPDLAELNSLTKSLVRTEKVTNYMCSDNKTFFTLTRPMRDPREYELTYKQHDDQVNVSVSLRAHMMMLTPGKIEGIVSATVNDYGPSRNRVVNEKLPISLVLDEATGSWTGLALPKISAQIVNIRGGVYGDVDWDTVKWVPSTNFVQCSEYRQ